MLLPRPSPWRAIRVAVFATLAAALVGWIAWRTGMPFLFPALGASTFIVFALPGLPAAAPRNVILSHFVAAATGWLCIHACSVDPRGATLSHLFGMPHILATSLSLGITTLLMLLLDAPHPPAGATTLIVSLGSMPEAWHIGVVVGSCVLLVALAHLAHAAFGEAYPIWRPPTRRGAAAPAMIRPAGGERDAA